ncbi:hypothetical protein G6F56_002254 [Rhizopus delemar]|uniref:DUF1279 domain-containing protein n=1 Tax=Rhizopus stolonifer TaxID=4846 RepID=A0A367KNI9_RHIST|nr:hypothetical protein G6F56_002254 [Rhizopus delemar]RCI03796.1 hypothetical protein CU098_012003 [Rhizopus stolonifer]
MSFRSTLALRLLRQNITNTAFRPNIQIKTPLNQKNHGFFLAQSHMKRFYTSPSESKQGVTKISNMVSSPELIKAVKMEPKVSKLKELSQKYGAVGILVYLGVGVVDLGITFGIIQFAGLEKVKALEEGALEIVRSAGEKIGFHTHEATDKTELLDKKDEDPSFTSVFILAYGIHKTLLLPVRLGITAAITPAIVRKIHQLGWARYFPKLLGAATTK